MIEQGTGNRIKIKIDVYYDSGKRYKKGCISILNKAKKLSLLGIHLTGNRYGGKKSLSKDEMNPKKADKL
ncbi:MAG: hypothetical protein F6K40_13590 [Okeania sp. SIO3I5]|uniref:hypothetical protein n=1 Tax=Okeania sp. SIO3I5 TaxID=2607805 RepID=UPI0013B928CE|nr:hypothetical protein [Okeania sp. SIO3I5]NEQ37242.1 hypothetical protein [Okeania sp. SIO3I5]